MTEIKQLIVDDQDFWLGQLPNYQQSGIRSMLGSGLNMEDAAAAWLSGAVASTTAPFSAGLGPRVFFEKFLDQLHDFLCTGLKYEEERAAVMAGFKPKQAGLAATISAAIAPHLQAAPAFLTPAIALTVCAIAKMGLGAWCQMQTERRASAESEPSQTNTDSDGPIS